uniref:Kinetochore associated 1 n=1 Tax=Nothobranchius kuhntae TaxID=321403 RepID=A0A1A8IE11_NOTKU
MDVKLSMQLHDAQELKKYNVCLNDFRKITTSSLNVVALGLLNKVFNWRVVDCDLAIGLCTLLSKAEVFKLLWKVIDNTWQNYDKCSERKSSLIPEMVKNRKITPDIILQYCSTFGLDPDHMINRYITTLLLLQEDEDSEGVISSANHVFERKMKPLILEQRQKGQGHCSNKDILKVAKTMMKYIQCIQSPEWAAATAHKIAQELPAGYEKTKALEFCLALGDAWLKDPDLEEAARAPSLPLSPDQRTTLYRTFVLLLKCPILLNLDLIGIANRFSQFNLPAFALGTLLLIPCAGKKTQQVQGFLSICNPVAVLEQVDELMNTGELAGIPSQIRQTVLTFVTQNRQHQKLIKTKHFNHLKQFIVTSGQPNQVKDLVDCLISQNCQDDADSLTHEYLKHRERQQGKRLRNGSISHNCLKEFLQMENEVSE